MGLLVERGIERLPPLLVEPGVTGVPHDGEQPGPAILPTKPIKGLERPQVGVLHHIFRILRITHYPPRQIVSGVEMW